MRTPLRLFGFRSAPALRQTSDSPSRHSPAMAFGGIGSRSSPIVIDDDDDDDALPLPSARVDSSSSTLPKDSTPPQPVDLTEAWDPTPARQENQLRTGKGYSILVRMGYKPGYGLGVNLEGIRPLSVSLLCG